MSTRILFIRHGQSEANLLGFFGGQTDVSLTDEGKAQAEKAARFTAENFAVDAIYSSSLPRAVQTAEPLSRLTGKPIICDRRLAEICGGDLEGVKFEEVGKRYPELLSLWQNDMSKVELPNGENVYTVQKRGFEAIKDICRDNPGKTVVIVTHRVMLRTLQCLWENRPLTEINDCAWINNCSVNEVIFKNGKLTPVNINRTDFLGDNVTRANIIM